MVVVKEVQPEGFNSESEGTQTGGWSGSCSTVNLPFLLQPSRATPGTSLLPRARLCRGEGGRCPPAPLRVRSRGKPAPRKRLSVFLPSRYHLSLTIITPTVIISL